MLNAIVFHAAGRPLKQSTDIAGIYIPDLIKVDLSPAVPIGSNGTAAAPTE